MRSTILYCSARRQPRFDWMADSLLNAGIESFDTEIVVVDAQLWYRGGERRAELESAVHRLREAGVQVTHLPPKPCRWQGPARLTKSDFFALSSARNTGLVVARGDRIIALDDCSVVPEDWLRRHLGWPPNALVAGSFYTYRTAKVVDGRIVDGDHGPYGEDPRRKQWPESMRINAGAMYGLSNSYPLEAALRANGCDEIYDSQGGSEDCDFGIRMERAGFACFWDPGIVVTQILESHEAVFEHSAWGLQQPVRRAPKERIVRRDGKRHFANEVLAEKLVMDDHTRFEPCTAETVREVSNGTATLPGNPFSLYEMREHYQRTGKFLAHPFDPIDWRDGQPLAEME